MSGRYYIMYNPTSVDFSHKIGEEGITLIDVVSLLSNGDLSTISENTYTDFLRFDFETYIRPTIPIPNTYTSYYIANQLAKSDKEAKIYIVDDIRNSFSQVISNETRKPVAVFITCISANFITGIATSLILNKVNVPVIFGGVHVTTSPKDVDIYLRQYASNPLLISQFLGGGDSKTIKTVIKDISSGKQKQEYHGNQYLEDGVWGHSNVIAPSGKAKPWLLKYHTILRYIPIDMIETKSVAPHLGCQYACSFCSIGALPKTQRELSFRDPKDFINEIKEHQKGKISFSNRSFFFVPDNLLIADNVDLLKKLRKSGAYLFGIGLESLDIRNLEYINKPVAKKIKRSGLTPARYYSNKIKIIQEQGIVVQGNFIFGLPYDYFNSISDHSAIEVVKFCKKNNIIGAPFCLTDLPGSKDFIKNQEIEKYPYKHGSIEYLLSLVNCDLIEGNSAELVPDSLKNSPLIPLFMLYYVANSSKSFLTVIKNLLFYSVKSWSSPSCNGEQNIKERIIDTVIIQCLILFFYLLYPLDYKPQLVSHFGHRGIFEKHFLSETNPQVKDLFKKVYASFI